MAPTSTAYCVRLCSGGPVAILHLVSEIDFLGGVDFFYVECHNGVCIIMVIKQQINLDEVNYFMSVFIILTYLCVYVA